MSTLKMQESTSQDDHLVKLRQQAVDKDIRYATLDNELHKKNKELVSVKDMLNETLGKFRKEADRVMKLEADLNRQAEDLRAERLNRQNLEASLMTANEKRASEEQTAKFLQMDLDTFASRMSSEHEMELKRLLQEKSTLEGRVRMLEVQSQASKPSQLPTRLPRPTTASSAASTVLEARIANLESDLSTARLELADASRALTVARQEAAKVPRLQSDLLAADNARLRAEKDAGTQRSNAREAVDQVKELEEELEYWRNMAGERSLDEGRLEDARKERDEAVREKEETQKRETVFRSRIRELEEAEAELVMGREEALSELHELQALSPTDLKMNETIIAELRVTLAERESALLNARGFTSELQQMYRDTLSACESAEERVRELELELHPAQANHPLVIVSPPPSRSPSTPFLAESEPMTKMSAKDEAIVARLLSAIERLRGERDALRRNLHFAQIEHRVADDALRARLDATEREVGRLEKVTAGLRDDAAQTTAEGMDELSRWQRELDTWRERFERADAQLIDRTAELADNEVEMDIMRVHLREVEESRDRLVSTCKASSRAAISSLISVQHLKSELDEAEERLTELNRNGEQASMATVRADLVSSDARLADAVKEVEQRDEQIADMQSRLAQYESQIIGLKGKLCAAREEQYAAQVRYSSDQQLSAPSLDGAEPPECQLAELEQRILRRTEQIGMLQHDTKRLETNLRVAEETIGELTAEVETLGQERACLIDDCAQAREARDEAHKRIEELEEEVESLFDCRDQVAETSIALRDAHAEVATSATSLETMALIVAESVTRSRYLHSALKGTRARLATVEASVHLAEREARDEAHKRIEELEEEVESLLDCRDQLAETSIALRNAHAEVTTNASSLETMVLIIAESVTRSRYLHSALKGTRARLATVEASVHLDRQSLAETVKDLELELAATAARYDAAQVEVHGLEHALAAARIHVDEDDASIAALQREKTALQVEHTQLAAELDRTVTKHQYAEQQAKRSDHEVVRLKSEVERLQGEVAKLDEAAQTAEINLCFKTNQYEQKLAKMQCELETQQSHLQCQDSISRLNENIAHMEEMLRMKSVEIEEKNARFNEVLKERTENDASIEALQREKTALQVEHTRLAAVLDRTVTKHQYAEQQAKRSDHEVVRLKSEVERLQGEVATLDEAAQTAEINLSFKTNQYEQKLAKMQRELETQQSHLQCQDSISELNEKIEYMEEMLRVKSVEIEENDDRFIEVLKERKRLINRVDSLTRKVQTLQTKLADLTAAPAPSSTSTPPLLTVARPKTPSPPLAHSMPSAGPFNQPPTRIPSSPAAALRAKTPEPSQKTFMSRMITPEPPVPALPNVTYKTPDQPLPASRTDAHRPVDAVSSFSDVKASSPNPMASESRKRRVPDDFDSPAPGPADAVVASIYNTPPRRIRRPTSDGRSGFTPTRNNIVASSQRPIRQQPSPLKRSIVPLAESTNSPRGGSKPIGLGKPVSVSKPPVRSWLSKSRALATGATRSASVLP